MGGNDTRHENLKEHDKENKRAGVAIIVRTNMLHVIKEIHRINGRMMEIRIKCESPINNISIINTYAPHSGYEKETINL